MNEHVTSRENFLSQYPYFWDVVKTVMTNAFFIQVWNPVTQDGRGSFESLRSLATQHLPAEGRVFSLLPVAPGGRSKTLDRYLLLWCSMTDPGYPSLPPHVSSEATNIIVEVASNAGFGCFMRDMGEIEREQLVAHCKESMERNPTKTTGQHLHEIVLEGIQAVLGRPMAEARSETVTSSSSSLQQNAESSSIHHQIRNFNVESNVVPEGKGKQKKNDAAIDADPIGSSQLPRDPKDTKQIFNRFPTVELVSPPPDDPTAPKLRPVTVHNPQPEDDMEPPKFSPLEYTTSVGNASIVHQIYLEARTTGIPRTAEQEVSRRRRATEMAIKETKAVAQERIKIAMSLPKRPTNLLEGIEHVPKEEKRKWLLEKRATMMKWRRECQALICDNNKAAKHIFVIQNALHKCRRAGAEGIIF
ncbi:hypothetical protein FS837_004599 [Tulasnella sp. UAMH 9824]|nr:hypothetical protein FS837_004599 [Tulasnella sp. UAMH 9824]